MTFMGKKPADSQVVLHSNSCGWSSYASPNQDGDVISHSPSLQRETLFLFPEMFGVRWFFEIRGLSYKFCRSKIRQCCSFFLLSFFSFRLRDNFKVFKAPFFRKSQPSQGSAGQHYPQNILSSFSVQNTVDVAQDGATSTVATEPRRAVRLIDKTCGEEAKPQRSLRTCDLVWNSTAGFCRTHWM